MPRTTVFISYARVDIARVRELVEIVQAAGYDPWFDHRVLPGQNWQHELEQTIQASDLFLYALSPASVVSEWCRWEFGKAIELRLPVVPVLLQRDTKTTPPLSRLQYADFCDGPSPLSVAELIGGLRLAETIAPEKAPPVPPAPQGTPVRLRTGDFALFNFRTAAHDIGAAAGRNDPLNETKDSTMEEPPPEVYEPIGHAQVFAGSSLVQTWKRLPFEPETVLIPGGPFLMGSAEDLLRQIQREHVRAWIKRTEMPQQTLSLPDYRIGRYPVTVGEFRAFVDQGGYDEFVMETESIDDDDDHADEPPFHAWALVPWADDDRMPVVNVTWNETSAYTRWLSAVTDRAYRLPTEAEWEKAARGLHGNIYPWGNDWREGVCNTWESRIGRTTRVGQFSPQGDSVFGVADMAGNVLEWSLSRWSEHYEAGMDDDLEGHVARVVRGGSWRFNQYHARTAFRQDWLPYCRLTTIGFRVALAGIDTE